MDMKEELFISLVYRRTAIWDPSHRDHRDGNVINRLWKEISLELGINENELKIKWKGLRDCYARERRRNPNELTPQSSWHLFEPMFFLNDVTSNQDSVPNTRPALGKSTSQDRLGDIVYASQNELSIASRIYSNERPRKENDDEEIEEEENHSIVDIPDINEQELPGENASRGAKRKSCDDNWQENIRVEAKAKKLKILANAAAGETNDEDLLFFKSLLPDLRLFSRTKKIAIKIKMQELLLNELSSLQQQSTSYAPIQASWMSPPISECPNTEAQQPEVDDSFK
ncbi:uncharacterized protein [Palaemon carinicauda]|uniref:uncharacterized protein n=1 Tax=Palaemon carinicauda TaxID=392227 RepID=UPI0035B63DBA